MVDTYKSGSDGLVPPSIDQLKATLNTCDATQLVDLGLHIRTLQNPHAPLLQLPAELRVAISTFVLEDVLFDWSAEATQPRRLRSLIHKPMPRHHILLQICRLMRVDCAPLYAKWMMIERYDAAKKEWSEVPASTLQATSVQLVWELFSSVKSAKECVEERGVKDVARPFKLFVLSSPLCPRLPVRLMRKLIHLETSGNRVRQAHRNAATLLAMLENLAAAGEVWSERDSRDAYSAKC